MFWFLQFLLRRPTLRPTLDPSQTVVLNHVHGYSNRYNLCRGCTLYPRVTDFFSPSGLIPSTVFQLKTHLTAHTSLTYRCLESPTTPVKQNSKWGGYNLDVTWDHKIYTARKLGELPLRLQPKHPCPLIGWLALIDGRGTLIPAPLYGVC